MSLGVDLTHIDTHMGAVILSGLMTAYVELAYEYQLPAMEPRSLDEGIRRAFRSPAFELAFEQMLALAQDLRLPLVDYVSACLHPPEGRVESYIRLVVRCRRVSRIGYSMLPSRVKTFAALRWIGHIVWRITKVSKPGLKLLVPK